MRDLEIPANRGGKAVDAHVDITAGPILCLGTHPDMAASEAVLDTATDFGDGQHVVAAISPDFFTNSPPLVGAREDDRLREVEVECPSTGEGAGALKPDDWTPAIAGV